MLSWFLFRFIACPYLWLSHKHLTAVHKNTRQHSCLQHVCTPPSFVGLLCPVPRFALAVASRTAAATHFVHCSRSCSCLLMALLPMRLLSPLIISIGIVRLMFMRVIAWKVGFDINKTEEQNAITYLNE